MTIVYILAVAAVILIIGTYARRYLNRNEENNEEKDAETLAKEEVESMLVKHESEEKKDKND